MKCLKVLGLVAVAATALTAFLGASSASATVLCKTTTTPCTEKYIAGTKFDASLEPETSALLTRTSGSEIVTCTTSTAKGEIEAMGSANETTKVSITDLTFPQASCNNTVDVLNGTGTLEIHSIAGTDNGTVTARGFTVTVEDFGISCIYWAGPLTGAGIDLGTLTGGSMRTIDINAVLLKDVGSFLCPTTAIWNARYTITEPSGAVYVEPE